MWIGGKKGFRSQKEIEKNFSLILNVLKNSSEPLTMTEIRKALKRDKSNNPTISRYLKRMVETFLIIKIGEGRGAKYRPNLSKIMQMNQLSFFKKNIENQQDFFMSQIGELDVSVLGLKNESLTDYEKECLELFNELVMDSFFVLYKLKTMILAREKMSKQVIDPWIKFQLSLRQLSYKLEKDFVTNYKDLEILEEFQRETYRKRDCFGFLATIALSHSKEFWNNIENPILYFFEAVKNRANKYALSKFEELTDLTYRVTQSCLSSSAESFLIDFQDVRALTEEEKVRIRDLKPLKERYGSLGIELILKTFNKLEGNTFEETGNIVKEKIVKLNLKQVLKKDNLYNKFMKESYTKLKEV